LKKVSVLAGVTVLFTLATMPAAATESQSGRNASAWLYEVCIGVLAHDVDSLWSGSREESGVDLNAELVFQRPSFPMLSGTVRPNLGLSINNRGDTSKVYCGALWELGVKSRGFLNLGIGAAMHDGELETSRAGKKELGSRVLFRIAFELGYTLNQRHRVSFAFDHISNADLASPNEGLDTVGIRYGYLF
jgi:lipid A 3-O-deacylase